MRQFLFLFLLTFSVTSLIAQTSYSELEIQTVNEVPSTADQNQSSKIFSERSPAKNLGVKGLSINKNIESNIPSIGSMPMHFRLMVIGLIVCIVAIALGFILGPVSNLVYFVGSILVVVGLVLWLLELFG